MAKPSEGLSISSRRLILLCATISSIAFLIIGGTGSVTANPVPILRFFGTNGAFPVGRLTLGNDGNLYGITSSGGAFNQGTIFALSNNGVFTSLFSFDGTNGSAPYGSLIQAGSGEMYGSTSGGGANARGTVYKLNTNSELVTLLSFDGTNGSTPYSSLLLASDGNLCGTTSAGGENNLGTVFGINTNGVLAFLVSFSGSNGAGPRSALIEGAPGVFYGTTTSGGVYNKGTVFQVTTNGELSAINSLNAATGQSPFAGVTLATDGALYGVTSSGGAKGNGTLFRADLTGAVTVLFSFTNATFSDPNIGIPLTQAGDGNLYGCTFRGGSASLGQMFRIATNGMYQTIADFNGLNGSHPSGGLLAVGDSLYGVTQNGGCIGQYGRGVVFRVSVSLDPPSILKQPQSRMTLPNSNVAFSVSAAGQWPLYYQWFKDGTALTGSTNGTYLVANAQTADAGTYYLQISNLLGSVTSSNALLKVGPLAILSQPSNTTAAAGYPAQLSIAVVGNSPLQYIWRKNNTPIESASGPTLSISNSQPSDAGAYSVIVNNADGSATSSVAGLTIVSPYTVGTLAGTPGRRGEVNGPASSSQFDNPVRVAVDLEGNLYVSHYWSNVIRKISTGGIVSTFAGLGGSTGTNDGLGSLARFNFPEGLATDKFGNVYVADNFNHTIRKIAPDGSVTTVAGTPGVANLSDGPASSALFSQPSDLVVDDAGNIFVAEWGNQSIREILTNGMVVTLARTLNKPTGITLDRKGNIYFSDEVSFGAGGSVWRLGPDGVAVAIATVPMNLYGMAIDPSGNCFVSTLLDDTVRMITPEGNVVTVAGVSGSAGYLDGAGASSRFKGFRMGLARDASGNLYIADTANSVIRKAVPFVVATAPLSQSVLQGTPVTLRAEMGDTNAFAFQWLSNGTPIQGATNLTLNLGAMGRSNTGWYSLLVDNGLGNIVQLNALVRALYLPVLQSPEVVSNSFVRLLFQDEDGGVPFDLSKVRVQWRTNADEAAWQALTNSLNQIGTFVEIDDTNVTDQQSRIYRVMEQ